MFSITRTTGFAALLALSVLTLWSSDALAAGDRRHHSNERRHAVTHDSCRAHHPGHGVWWRHGHHRYARELVQQRDHLLQRATSSLFRADFERAGQLFWRANRVEHRLNQLRRVQRRHDCRPQRDPRHDRTKRDEKRSRKQSRR